MTKTTFDYKTDQYTDDIEEIKRLENLGFSRVEAIFFVQTGISKNVVTAPTDVKIFCERNQDIWR